MKAACQNAVRNWDSILNHPNEWYRCGFIGEVPSLESECPRCHNKGRLIEVKDTDD